MRARRRRSPPPDLRHPLRPGGVGPRRSHRGRGRRRASSVDSGVDPGNAPSRLRRYASWRKSQPWRWADAAQDASARSRARETPRLQRRGTRGSPCRCARTARSPSAAGRDGAPRRRGTQSAVLDDRDGCLRAAEHEAVLGDAPELPSHLCRARCEGRIVVVGGGVFAVSLLSSPRAGSHPCRRRRNQRPGCTITAQHRRPGATPPPESPCRPLVVPFRLHESRQGSRAQEPSTGVRGRSGRVPNEPLTHPRLSADVRSRGGGSWRSIQTFGRKTPCAGVSSAAGTETPGCGG